jgi:hydroxymethylglutaryl-CoA reductase
MAGELSLMSALAAGHLIKAHMSESRLSFLSYHSSAKFLFQRQKR